MWLKIKVASSIVATSSSHLLRIFLSTQLYSSEHRTWGGDHASCLRRLCHAAWRAEEEMTLAPWLWRSRGLI
ncbi:hypothetical protein [Ensifer sp. B1-9]|uniref:hypothetical protein n=1 Tax=Ensifer sp. B1-9 TaxID=3141455 RepID=UPI003D22F00B